MHFTKTLSHRLLLRDGRKSYSRTKRGRTQVPPIFCWHTHTISKQNKSSLSPSNKIWKKDEKNCLGILLTKKKKSLSLSAVPACSLQTLVVVVAMCTRPKSTCRTVALCFEKARWTNSALGWRRWRRRRANVPKTLDKITDIFLNAFWGHQLRLYIYTYTLILSDKKKETMRTRSTPTALGSMKFEIRFAWHNHRKRITTGLAGNKFLNAHNLVENRIRAHSFQFIILHHWLREINRN